MDPAACPDDETLAHFAEGRLSPDAAAALGAHTESCESCRQVVGLLLRLKSSTGGRVPSLAEPALAAPLLPLETSVGRYVLRRFVGAGAMGVVFEADDPALQRRVAVKVMRSATSDQAQALLQREAQVMAQLSHRNVATVFDVGVFEGRAWVAMEFIEGPTLREWLQQPREEAAVLQRLLDAGRGLCAAHAAGVVHRDFKPDNVLVENAAGHRTVVTDFGLSVGSAPREPAGRKVVGTPAYMAPEQRGGLADAASDQFAFCVTAVEAFTGKRPFDSGTLDAAVLARLPRRLRPALTRGLSASPRERWPSLDALLSVLAPPRRERQVAALVAGLSVLALGAVGATTWRRAHVCDSAGAAVGDVWNAQARAALTSAFSATGLPFAPQAAAGVGGELDRWAAGWAASATGVCEATELRHTQSGELMDLRRECLEERLLEVRALSAALAHVDAKGAQAAAAQGLQLTPLSVCDDERALKALVRAPVDPALAAQVKQVREALAKASALRVTSQFPAAKAALEPLERAAQEAKYRPLEADVLVQAGMLSSELEDYAGAREKLQRALVAAQAGGHVQAAAQAWIALTLLEGVHLGHPAEGHHAAELASAASERLGRPAVLEAPLATNLGTLLAEEGKHEDARASYQAALAAYRALDADTLTLAQALNAVGAQERSLGHVKEALALHEEALALVTSRYSATHPAVGPIAKNLGNVELEAGRFEAALAWYEKSLAVERAAFGESSLEVASTQSNIAASLLRQSKLQQAEPLLRSALKIVDEKLGPEHPSLLGPLNNLAVLLRYTDRLGDAEDTLRRALSIAQKTYGPMHEEVATTLINLGDVQLSRKDFAASVKSYEQAIVVTEKSSGPDHSNLADCWGGLAFPLMEQHEWVKALAATEKAQAIYAKSPGQPYPEGLVHFAHARALWEVAPARRAEAKKEAAAARASLEKVGAQPEELAEIDTWLGRSK